MCAFVRAARRLVDASDPLGREARRRLPETTGLSPAGVAFALEHCLEVHPSDAEIDSLVRAAPDAPHAHVLLSANVFTAPHRAICLALAASECVTVRASRREPVMAGLLCRASGGRFELVEALAPAPGDHVWGYGSDETLSEFHECLPRGVVYHPHGHGFGAAVVDDSAEALLADVALRLARDIVFFDQRGCLSPRFAVVSGPPTLARRLADFLAEALEELEKQVPTGRLDAEEVASRARFETSMLFVADSCQVGSGCIAVVSNVKQFCLPPVGRNLQILCVDDPVSFLGSLSTQLTQVGVACRSGLQTELERVLPGARFTPLGTMQCPPLDGPVDLRARALVVGGP